MATNPSPQSGPNPFQPIAGVDYAATLNEQQLAAVEAEPGPALVLAGAGSGKTRTLTYRVAYLLEKGVKPWEILLLTFTNKAAREMLERVEELTGVERRYFWGGTFHSIGQRLLRKDGQAVDLDRSFTIMDEGDAESLLKQTIEGIDSKYLKNKEFPKHKPIFNAISYARNTRRDVEEVAAEQFGGFPEEAVEKIPSFARAYDQQKRQQQICDYDDLLELWLRILQEFEHLAHLQRGRFRHILVDEFQDTNRLQFDIIRELAKEHRNLTIVGDNWQCIYTWRGAEFSNMEDFSEFFKEREIYKIETNYRSTPEILEFANDLMHWHPPIDGYPLELRAARERGRLPVVVSTTDTRQQAFGVIQRIRELAENDGRSLSEIAVLYRAHYHAMDLQMELSRQGIPYTITSGVRFFEQAHVRDITAHLRFVANPNDGTAFQRFATLLPRLGPKSAEKLYRHARKFAKDEQRNFFEILREAEVVKKVPKDAQEGWHSLAQTLHDIWVAANKDASDPSEAVRLAVEGWYQGFIRENYANWTQREDDLKSLIDFAARYEDLSDLLAQLVLLSSESNDRETSGQSSEGIRLTTIHQAKGLEFPVVFVIGLSDGQFPLQRAIDRDDLDEERRLFYVAVTRAMDEIYLMYPMIAMSGGPPRKLQPSRFLAEMPEHRYEVVRMQQMNRGW